MADDEMLRTARFDEKPEVIEDWQPFFRGLMELR